MGIGEDGYYTLRDILGYNAKYNIVLSDRGRGKSYGTKLFLMNQPGTAMCLYRTGFDMTSAMLDWIDPLIREGWDPEELEIEGTEKDGYHLLYREERKIWFRSISQVNRIKQEIFPDDMNWVWFDEFIPLAYKKLPGVENEGDAIRTIVKTIEHDTVHTREEKGLKPLRILMYANPFTWNNPLLSYFRIDPSKGYGIHKAGPGVVYEILEPMPEKKEGKQTAEDFLGNEINRNQGWMNEDAFVMPVPKGANPVYSIRFADKYFTVYQGNSAKWIVGKQRHTDIIKQYAGKSVLQWIGTLDGLLEDEICIDKSPMAKRIKEDTYCGRFRFDNLNTKFDWLRCLEMI